MINIKKQLRQYSLASKQKVGYTYKNYAYYILVRQGFI